MVVNFSKSPIYIYIHICIYILENQKDNHFITFKTLLPTQCFLLYAIFRATGGLFVNNFGYFLSKYDKYIYITYRWETNSALTPFVIIYLKYSLNSIILKNLKIHTLVVTYKKIINTFLWTGFHNFKTIFATITG